MACLLIRPRALGSIRLHLADSLLQRQPLARDVGFLERGIDAAQLVDQRRTRALIQHAAILARIVFEAGDGTGGIGRVARTGPALVFGLLQQLQALGLDVPTIMAQIAGGNGGAATKAAKAVEQVVSGAKSAIKKTEAPEK